MQVVNDIKDDVKAAKKVHIPWWGILCISLGSLPIVLLFDHLGRFNMALPTLNCIGMLAFAIFVKWRLRRHAWFWVTMAILAALHVPLILFVPWTDKWVPAFAIAGLDSIDLIVMFAILEVIAKLMEEPKTSEG